MRFLPTELSGVVVVEVEAHTDERGLFARTFDRAEFAEEGLVPPLEQFSTSYNAASRTLRGLHYQAEPDGETKLVRCTQGAAFDVIVDVRPSSATYRRWVSVELSASNRRAVYIPAGYAHGFLTLEAGTEMLYQIDRPYVPGAARGVRWNDPAVGIAWPHEPAVMSHRDATFEDLQ